MDKRTNVKLNTCKNIHAIRQKQLEKKNFENLTYTSVMLTTFTSALIIYKIRVTQSSKNSVSEEVNQMFMPVSIKQQWYKLTSYKQNK